MNIKITSFIKSFSYSLFSNLISLMISTLVVLIVPKVIGVEEYGYWQLYLFYSSYVGFLQFGWNDGIYLRYGGFNYEKLDKNLFFSQYWMLVVSQVMISIMIIILTKHFTNDNDKTFIFYMIAVCLILSGVNAMLLFLLQATNRIREYAQITIIGRLSYFLLIIIFLTIEIKDYKLMIVSDLVGRLFSLIYATYCCKEIVYRKISVFKFSFKETYENIYAGIKLMFSNIASMLIIGIVRFSIEKKWGVSTFGKVSLTLSISNMMMIFINAMGIIMYPILRRINKERLPEIYSIMRDLLIVPSLGVLILYYPLKTIIGVWLPQYSESLQYMALLFPMVIYEGKMSLLINTYLKALRREKIMLKINIITMMSSLLLTFISTTFFNNLDITVVNIVILLAFRSILSECYLSRVLVIDVRKDIVLELLLTFIFILLGWFINSWICVIFYSLIYIIYILLKKNGIYKSIGTLKLFIKD